MNATEFLIKKGLVKEDHTHFLIKTEDGKYLVLNDLLEEYKSL